MAFLDQIGKKISDTGQGMAKQTKDFMETTRLGSAISDNEKKIARLYADLGKAYYEAHANDPGAEQREMLAEIKALFDDIAAKQEEIKQIKGVMKCPNCGADIPANSAFCNGCGWKVTVAAKGRTCAKCGAAIPEGDRFCSVCGSAAE